MTYIGRANRRKKMNKINEDFSSIDADLKFNILKFVSSTLVNEMNESFRSFLNEILFLILKEKEQYEQKMILFNQLCENYIKTAYEFIKDFGSKLLQMQPIQMRIHRYISN